MLYEASAPVRVRVSVSATPLESPARLTFGGSFDEAGRKRKHVLCMYRVTFPKDYQAGQGRTESEFMWLLRQGKKKSVGCGTWSLIDLRLELRTKRDLQRTRPEWLRNSCLERFGKHTLPVALNRCIARLAYIVA